MKKAKIYTINDTYTGEEIKVIMRYGRYIMGNHLYIGLDYICEEGIFPYTNITVNLPAEIKENEAFIDVNNFSQAINFIQQNGLGEITHFVKQSGYVIYPLCKFNLNKIKNEGKEIK